MRPVPPAETARGQLPVRRRRVGTAVLAGIALLLSGTSCTPGPTEGPAGASPMRSAAAPGGGTHLVTLPVDGRQRTYRAHVPASVAGRTGVPVVITLHGAGGTGEIMDRQSRMSEEADRGGFIAVFPDGSGRLADRLLTWNAGTCCGYSHSHAVDDVAFVAALIANLVTTSGVDPRRVYVAGFSNGAMMAHRVACELSDRIAAIAVVSGALNTLACRPTRPVAVLIIHGTADTVVPYGGGRPTRPGLPAAADTVTSRSVAEAVASWTGHNRCSPGPVESRDGPVTRTEHRSCAGGTAVELYTVDGGGHAWPGGVRIGEGDPPPSRPDATAVSSAFLRDHIRAD